MFRDEPVLENAARRAAYLTAALGEALGGHKNVGEIRRIGLIHAAELTPDRETKAEYPSKLRVGYQIYKKALRRGLILRPLGNVIYFNPPLTIREEEIDKAVSICQECVTEVLERV